VLPIEQIHPVVLHFPIVFTLTLVVFDATALSRGALIGGRRCVANVSTGLAVLAGIAAAVTFIFGDLAFDAAIAAGAPDSLLETHEELGEVTAFVLLAWAIIRGILWWRKMPLAGYRGLSIVVIEFGISALIVTTAYFGGQLVYEFGVGVTSALPVVN